jgi:hypothetical protein
MRQRESPDRTTIARLPACGCIPSAARGQHRDGSYRRQDDPDLHPRLPSLVKSAQAAPYRGLADANTATCAAELCSPHYTAFSFGTLAPTLLARGGA